MTTADTFVCQPWCTDGDGHPNYVLRADQSCWGPQHKVLMSLDDHAPGTDRPPACDDPAISVYAYQGYYALPKIKLHIYRDGPGECGVDADFLLTPAEARQLAQHLAAVADLIGGNDG